MTLVLMAAEKTTFADTDRVKVDYGTESMSVAPLPVDVGLYGLRSQLPPP